MATDTGHEWVPRRPDLTMPQGKSDANRLRAVDRALLTAGLLAAGVIALRPIASVDLRWLFWPAVLCWLLSIPHLIFEMLNDQKLVFLKIVLLPPAVGGSLLLQQALFNPAAAIGMFLGAVVLTSGLAFIMAREYSRYAVRAGAYDVATKRAAAGGVPWKFAIVILPVPGAFVAVAMLLIAMKVPAFCVVPLTCWSLVLGTLVIALGYDPERRLFLDGLRFWFTYNRSGRKPPHMHQLHEPFDRAGLRRAAVFACIVLLAFGIVSFCPLPQHDKGLYVTFLEAFTTRAAQEETRALIVRWTLGFLLVAPLPPLMFLAAHGLMTSCLVRLFLEPLEVKHD